MDSIDITDSAFSLEVNDVNQIIGKTNMDGDLSNDYTLYIYVGITILLLIVGMFIFKFYQNKKNNENIDCTGGFCNQNSREF